jgi:hypothetical protein
MTTYGDSFIIATLGSSLANDASGINFNHSHTNLWNAVVPPELSSGKEQGMG